MKFFGITKNWGVQIGIITRSLRFARFNLRDLGFSGDMFTWCNRRNMGAQVSLRLDRFIVNPNFCSLFENFQVTNLDWAKSDHRPIELHVEGLSSSRVRGRRRRIFKFEEGDS